ncbi:hypothetical protein T4D_12674 [Trichinella pseudospiralis]|uniref:Uncharacterized protein n=1 Tax=Trichinella pseudospiralis TaxID=6337 RepID=A0A0V1FWI8_TRIPS|nr:hypothetical protein T4D_12674 [Trichinella pseudospiralis]
MTRTDPLSMSSDNCALGKGNQNPKSNLFVVCCVNLKSIWKRYDIAGAVWSNLQQWQPDFKNELFHSESFLNMMKLNI